MLGIINYGMGNIYSILNALDKVGLRCNVINNPKKVKECDAIILPGVGAFKDAMKNIHELGYEEAINQFVATGKYCLGICLGMQLFMTKSYEFGEHKGLNYIEGDCIKFKSENNKKMIIPHTMWNNIIFNENNNDLKIFSGLENSAHVYFVHSFHTQLKEKILTLTKTNYEDVSFVSSFMKNNIIGLQFHPELSGKTGLKLLMNFGKLIKKND